MALSCYLQYARGLNDLSENNQKFSDYPLILRLLSNHQALCVRIEGYVIVQGAQR